MSERQHLRIVTADERVDESNLDWDESGIDASGEVENGLAVALNEPLATERGKMRN